ncbi:MAG: hypothetical protein AAB472_02070 [Patescibacteria group bacterium]
MYKRVWNELEPLVVVASVLALLVIATIYSENKIAQKVGMDASGKWPESPKILYPGGGAVSTAYSVSNSPRLERWSNGRIVVTCPVGYHFKVEARSDAMDPPQYEEATCEPNPINAR